ncbi:S8 family serine peptidase [Hymenobacter weizhouensis]|uniref:S8 family serine peptidase n=1 Tax=Hymenobacter sp. YIM 151500-1 TaxID=2987689 RepID=UPI00222610F9|nr:S8 family serine peptidase [Hymenobacter sp. YIM 151500-1]UYZ61767.1 S8 family serine peptidase [Hymenobacter sp. YIM 151500-1]
MKHLLPLLTLLALAEPAASLAQQPAPRLLVRLADSPRTAQAQENNQAHSTLWAFEQLNRRYGAVRTEALNPSPSPSSSAATAGVPAVYVVTLPAGTDAGQVRAAYQQSGLFRYVELDAAGRGGGQQGLAPNDALYGRQWSLNNTGSFSLSSARPGADMKMEDGWAITQGDASVTVAIIDSGCKLDHPEFSGRLWRNAREIPANNLDDDQNGYVDDINGWSFVDETANLTDDVGHGTNVTGIIGASGNNSVGYAGVNWGCKLMTCKALDDKNNGFYSWWIKAIYYAVNNGARVINMSLGGTSSSQAMQDAVDYATQRGVVVVACMMNANSSTVYYPAGLTGVIAVGSTNPDDTRSSPFFWNASSGSSFGPHVSVVAPGNYIYGLHHRSDNNYNTYWGGTSQAAPHVAGLASLLLTLKPQLTPAQVKTTLQSTADDLVGNPAEDTPGWDQYYGHGRINAARALSFVVTSSSQASRLPQAALDVFPNPARHQLTLRTSDARLLNQQVQIFNSVGQLVYHQALTSLSMQVPLTLAPGVYRVSLAGTGRTLVVE